jgi:hypothetical protein
VTTALDILTDSLNLIGVYSPGEPLSAADEAQALTRLNDMLDSWSNESLICWANVEQSTVFVPGKMQYTIGLSGGADIALIRPLSLRIGVGAAYVQDFNGNNYLMEVVPQYRWNQIGNRNSLTTQSNFPDTLFYNPQYPLGILNVFPAPTIGYTMYWDSYLQLADFANAATAFSAPSGYLKAMKDVLALELWPYFKQDSTNPPQWLLQAAKKSKGNIKRLNGSKENIANFDPEIIRSGQSSVFNVYTYNYSR